MMTLEAIRDVIDRHFPQHGVAVDLAAAEILKMHEMEIKRIQNEFGPITINQKAFIKAWEILEKKPEGCKEYSCEFCKDTGLIYGDNCDPYTCLKCEKG